MIYTGLLTSLISVGFFICLKYCNVFLMSYGGIVLAGSYAATLVPASIPGWFLALILSIFLGALLGGVHYILLRSALKRKQNNKSLLLTWGFALILAESFRLWFGSTGRFASPFLTGTFFDLSIPNTRIFSLIVATTLLLSMLLVLKLLPKVRLRLEAMSEDYDIAAELGVPANVYLIAGFVVAGIVAAISGLLMASDNAVTPYLGFQYTITAALAGLIVGPKILHGILIAFALGALKILFGFYFGLTLGWLLVLLVAITFAAINKPLVVKYGS